MSGRLKQHHNKGIFALLATLIFFSGNIFARTQVIDANVDSIKPIYMNYTIERIVKPCQTKTPSCWNVAYQQRSLKSLQGYRVKLSYQDQQFTARMRAKPEGEQLKIRVSTDLLGKASNLAMNAAVVY